LVISLPYEERGEKIWLSPSPTKGGERKIRLSPFLRGEGKEKNLKHIMPEQRIVHCVKLNKDLPGLDRPPILGELGKRVYENVSKEAFKMFLEYFKMIMNEYRLDMNSPQSDKIFEDQMKEFFFGEGAAPPEQYVPEK
jgi:Fe-S cluster biosynthesis and repair protein YggX